MSKGRRTHETTTVAATLGELADSLPVMGRIISQPFSPGGSVQVYDRWTRIAKMVLSEVDESSAYEVLRMKLVREFGTLNEKTNQWEVQDPDKYRAYVKALNELRAQGCKDRGREEHESLKVVKVFVHDEALM